MTSVVLLRPANNNAPGPFYWINETSGYLAVAVNAYLRELPLSDVHISYLRAYLRQWMTGNWRGPRVEELRCRLDGLTTRDAIREWLALALHNGIDPL